MSRGLTIAVLKSGGTKPEANEVLMLVIVGRRTSRFSYSNSVGVGSRSHDLGTVFWRISETNCSVTGVNVCGNFLEKVVLSMATVGVSGGKLFLIVMILLVKYSEKGGGMLSESKEDGKGVEFFLPRMALKLWNSSLHELLVCILKE